MDKIKQNRGLVTVFTKDVKQGVLYLEENYIDIETKCKLIK